MRSHAHSPPTRAASSTVSHDSIVAMEGMRSFRRMPAGRRATTHARRGRGAAPRACRPARLVGLPQTWGAPEDPARPAAGLLQRVEEPGAVRRTTACDVVVAGPDLDGAGVVQRAERR